MIEHHEWERACTIWLKDSSNHLCAVWFSVDNYRDTYYRFIDISGKHRGLRVGIHSHPELKTQQYQYGKQSNIFHKDKGKMRTKPSYITAYP